MSSYKISESTYDDSCEAHDQLDAEGCGLRAERSYRGISVD